MILASGLGIYVNAQNDVSVSLNNFTSMEATSANPLDMVFTITNESASSIPAGDTVFFAFVVGTSNFSMDLTPGAVSYIKLSADLTAGSSIDLSALTTPPSTMTMDWVYSELGTLNGNVCAFAGVGALSLSLSPGSDANFLDNTMCVNYTVTEVTGIDGIGTNFFSVFPNPATGVLNFQIGNNELTHIDVFDISGRLITTVKVSGSLVTIDVTTMENGVYFYRFMNGDELILSDKFTVAK